MTLRLLGKQKSEAPTPSPLSAAMGALNPLRNKASVAHPNAELLDEPEAMLVINAARTILHYLDAKLT